MLFIGKDIWKLKIHCEKKQIQEMSADYKFKNKRVRSQLRSLKVA